MRQKTPENQQLREFQTIDAVAQMCQETRHITTVTRVAPDESEGEQRSPGVTTTSAFGYKPTCAGLVDTPPSLHELHALITPPEAARLLNLSERALENWRHRGGGPRYVRVSGRCIRYRRGDILAWIGERLRVSTSDSGGQEEAAA